MIKLITDVVFGLPIQFMESSVDTLIGFFGAVNSLGLPAIFLTALCGAFVVRIVLRFV